VRVALAAVFLFAAAISPTGVAAQVDDHRPAAGCALPNINEMVRSVFESYSPGKTLAFDNDRLVAEIRWATAKGATNNSVSNATLEPIARQVLIPK